MTITYIGKNNFEDTKLMEWLLASDINPIENLSIINKYIVNGKQYSGKESRENSRKCCK